MKKFYSIIYLFCLAFFIISANFKFVAAVEVLPAPVISVNPDIYYPLDEVLYLEGRAKPKSTIELYFQKSGAKPKRFTVKSDPTGEWVFAERVPLEEGDWEVRTRLAQRENGAGGGQLSEWSNPRVFKVVQTGVTLGGFNIKFAALSLLILVLLISGVALILYFGTRVRRLRARLLAKEVREAHESVREGLAELRHDLLEELRSVESSGKPSGPEEISRKDHILREIEKVEKNMEREIGDIEERM